MTTMLLEWVFTSMFLILVVLALRAALGRRVSAGLRYGLWAVVLVRLLVPIQLFTSPIAGTWVFSETRTEQSMYAPASPASAPPAAEDAPALDKGDGQEADAITAPHAPGAPSLPDAPEPPAAPDLTRAPGWLGWVWLAGAAAVAFVLLLSNLRFFRRLRRVRIPLETADCPLSVYVAVGLPSPCLFGIFRPAVYITPEAAADPAMLHHVLAHEYTHCRHGDHVWSLLRCAALAVHWWNPLVWLAADLSRRDGELACDEGALKRLGEGERAAYGSTLLALVTAKPRPGDLLCFATTMAGDKKSLKERVSRIACAPRRWLWAAAAMVLAAALACLCAFGQAEPAEPSDDVDNLNPTYTMNGDRNVLIGGLGDGCVVDWSRGTNGGTLYLAGDLEYFCPKLAGESTEGGADWEDAEKNVLHVRLNVNDDRIEDGTVNGFGIDFTVDLSSDTVTRKKFTSQLGDRTIELTDQEMLDMAHILSRLLTEAADYYNSHAAGEPADLRTHFPADVENVPSEVLKAIAQDVEGGYENFLLCLDYQPIAVENNGLPEFDDWRVKTLDGPWTTTALGMNVEIWRGFSEYHTPEPEKAKYMLAGGMYVTEDGWFSPEDRMKYYIFELDQEGGRRLATIMIMGAGGGAPDGETQTLRDEFDVMVERALADARVAEAGNLSPDLNRNGIPEELRLASIDGGAGQRLEVWEGGRLIFSEEGYHAHAGYNALFLYRHGSGDYLLRYNPYMGQGWCTYSCKLFTLSETGEERTIREDGVEFDINFGSLAHEGFDPEAIAGFMDEVNGLLADSVPLLNTDEELLATFEEEGRLYDSLWWLDIWGPAFTRDPSKSLLENLRDFQAAMEGRQYAETPSVFPVDEYGTDILLRYQDRSTRFEGEWDCYFQPAEYVEPQVVDLNGDGREEIVVILNAGHGTGAYIEKLYVFDAETLEQYDTSGLNEMVLNSIRSTGDEDWFYLQGPGMPGLSLNKHAPRDNPNAPIADAISLGNSIRYTVSDGVVYCWLGCDMSGALIGYEGYLKVWLEFTDGGSFQGWHCNYVESIEY